MNKYTVEHSVFLNERGIEALSHLGDIYLRDNHILDCVEAPINTPHYLEVKIHMQGKYDLLPPGEGLVHLLIPHDFVSLVVLDKPSNPVGFVQK